MVNGCDIDGNTRPRSADYREGKIEATVDEGGREQNPVRTMTQEDVGTKQQDDSKLNSTGEGKGMEGSKVGDGGVVSSGMGDTGPV